MQMLVHTGNSGRMDNAGSQEASKNNKRELRRCPQCNRFYGPRDAVCGDCGTAHLHFINERAKILGLSPASCHHHYYVDSELGEVCVACSHVRMSGEPPSPELSTRTNHICSCCGSQIHGADYCTTCGAHVSFYSTLPALPDKTALRYMTQHANYIEQRDPHYEFKIYSPMSHGIWLFVLLFIAIEIAIVGPVGVASFYVSQRKVNEVTTRYELAKSDLADLTEFYQGGFDPSSEVIWNGGKPVHEQLVAMCKAQAASILNGTAGLAWTPPEYDAYLLHTFITTSRFGVLDSTGHDLYKLVVTGPTVSLLRQKEAQLPPLSSDLAKAKKALLSRTLKPFIFTLPAAIALGIVLLFLVLRAAMHRRADSFEMTGAHKSPKEIPADGPVTGGAEAGTDSAQPAQQGAVAKGDASSSGDTPSGKAHKHWWDDSTFLRVAIGLTLLVLAEIVVVGIAYVIWNFKNWATSLDFIWRLGPAGGTALWTFYIVAALVAVVTLLVWIEFLDRLDYQRRHEEWVKSAHRYRFESTLENEGL